MALWGTVAGKALHKCNLLDNEDCSISRSFTRRSNKKVSLSDIKMQFSVVFFNYFLNWFALIR